jgi:spermidine/putrescine transport system ATP-binding protein
LALSKTAIEAKGVSRIFSAQGRNPVAALDNVSVQILENEFFTLLGPSGCGKTTLLRLIAGFDFPTAGEILLYGEDIAVLPPFKRPVNTVFQNYALFPHMTVAENIAFGLEMLSQPRPEIDARVLDMLRLVRMEEMADRKTSQISGGQQQRVALARALAPRPKVLLLDEPLSALDYKLRKDMQIELKRLQHETGITFIFVTHDQEEALTMSDRIAVMSNGKILQVGTPHEIYEAPTSRFVANFIGETNFIKSKDGATMVVRPEHATLVKPAQGTLKGVINNIVYFGTDTHFHVRLEDGSDFMVRQQNNGGEKSTYEVGAKTGVVIAAGAAKILQD